MSKTIKIATRNSSLALLQTQAVIDKIIYLDPSVNVEIVPMVTRGDQGKIHTGIFNGKALFVSELQEALLSGKADLAVHSLKDMAIKPHAQLMIVACMKRQDPSDAFISHKYESLELMPKGAIVGTASIRRQKILQKYFPQLNVREIRGNVDTRLRKLEEEFDAIILATNGLDRLSYQHRITQKLSTDIFIPAIGQAVIAIEANPNNPIAQLARQINDPATFLCVQIERHIGCLLGADCGLPIAVYVQVHDNLCIEIIAMSALNEFIVVQQKTALADLSKAIRVIVDRLSAK